MSLPEDESRSRAGRTRAKGGSLAQPWASLAKGHPRPKVAALQADMLPLDS
jgi:hypothetical protein